jgi:hypothetical protein
MICRKTIYKKIDGVNTPHWHAGEKLSGTSTHKEDMGFRSLNLCVLGWKLWIMVRTGSTQAFEKYIKRAWKPGTCDEFVRHCSLLVDPEVLQHEGIEFDIPGDLIVTQPRQYHSVLNVTKSLALSINFLFPGEPIIPEGVRVCPECGLYPLNDKNFIRVDAPIQGMPNKHRSDGHSRPAKRRKVQGLYREKG